VIIRRRNLNYVGTNNLTAENSMENIHCFPARKSTDLRRAGARSICGIDAVDIKGDVKGAPPKERELVSELDRS